MKIQFYQVPLPLHTRYYYTRGGKSCIGFDITLKSFLFLAVYNCYFEFRFLLYWLPPISVAVLLLE